MARVPRRPDGLVRERPGGPRERSERRAVVEQEAVSRMMMFSKKVHLMLEITEEGHEIRFAIGAAG